MNDEARIDRAIQVARQLLQRAQALDAKLSKADVRANSRLALLIADSSAKELTFQLTDEVSRPYSVARSARRLNTLVSSRNTSSFSPWDRVALRVGAKLANVVPWLIMPLVERRLIAESKRMIVDSAHTALSNHQTKMACLGFRSNINALGESIVGNHEAEQRLTRLVELLSRADVNYISVKASAICAGLHPVALEANVDRVSKCLARLFAEASRHAPAKFVNVDMEEFRDVELTVASFCKTLDLVEFRHHEAGIVLQAYLPDSVELATRLGSWARDRVRHGGSAIKIRVVKGANLAMEIVESELHSWPVAPYESKAEVDANYKRVLDILLASEFDDVLRVGLASHNVFDVAWGLGMRADLALRGQESRLEFEMLAGMASSQAQALNEIADGVLLYTPVVSRNDFGSAVAYLMRRLDENTTPENFLAHILEIEPHGAIFEDQARRFVDAVRARNTVSTVSHRHQFRDQPSTPVELATPFSNEPDTDFSVSRNRAWVARHIANFAATVIPEPPTIDDIDVIVAAAQNAALVWAEISTTRRAEIVHRIGNIVANERGAIVASMAHTASKAVVDGDSEVSEAADFARYYAHRSLIDGREMPEFMSRIDGGVVVVAAPWNFPYAIALGGVVASLAAGHAVILKPAPQTRAVAQLIVDHCMMAGVPLGVVQFAPCDDDDAGQRLITHPHVTAVVLTGAQSTGQMFLTWKPALRLHGETSGKNSMIITGGADVDLALKDLVRSAFGHAGQKCSAASLAIVTDDLLEDPKFLTRLRDATTSLVVGIATELTSDVTPIVGSPTPDLLRALTHLDPGEEWLVEPRLVDPALHLWSPGVRIGVTATSWFATTECFGPVLGIIRAADLSDAIGLQNSGIFGLTAGLHTLDTQEIDVWVESAQAGNLYINRTMTGAIVQRQPFGGWKRSVVGPTAKAGGPFYVASLSRWATNDCAGPSLKGIEEAFQLWARVHMMGGFDATGMRAESNVYRHVCLPGGVAIRANAADSGYQLTVATLASAATGTRLIVSDVRTECDEDFAARLPLIGVDRLRIVGGTSELVRRTAHSLGIAVDDQIIVPWSDAELWRWTREQSISRTLHRHGHLAGAA